MDNNKCTHKIVTFKIWIKGKEPYVKRQEHSARKSKIKILTAIKPMM